MTIVEALNVIALWCGHPFAYQSGNIHVHLSKSDVNECRTNLIDCLSKTTKDKEQLQCFKKENL